MKLAIATGSIFFALTGSLAAQPGTTPYAPPPQPAPVPVPVGEELSEGTALALSLGGTLVPWALAVAAPYVGENSLAAANTISLVSTIGIVIGPSLGHWYAGKYLTPGMGLRLGGGALAIVGGILFFASTFSFGHDDSDDDSGGGAAAGALIMIGGAGMLVGGTIHDVVTAPRRVRRHNEARAGYAIAPLVTDGAAGLVLGGRF